MSTMALKRSISVTMETQSALDLRNQPEMKRARTEPMVKPVTAPVTPERVQNPLSCPMAPKKCAKPLVLENITEADPMEIEEHETNGTMDALINREPRTITPPLFDGILTQAETEADDTINNTIGALLTASESMDIPIDLTSQSVQESQEPMEPIDLTVSQPVDEPVEPTEPAKPVDNVEPASQPVDEHVDTVEPVDMANTTQEAIDQLALPEENDHENGLTEYDPVWKSMTFEDAMRTNEALFFRFESDGDDEREMKPFCHCGVWDGLFDFPKNKEFMDTIRLRMLDTPFAKERKLTMEDFETRAIFLVSYNMELISTEY